MSDIKYTQDHEWIRMEDAEVGVCGITDYAQEQLGEIVFVELPDVDTEVERGNESAVIESVKAAGELKSPVSGRVVAVNDALADAPETINNDAMKEGWILKLRLSDPGQLDTLMDEDAYASYIAEL